MSEVHQPAQPEDSDHEIHKAKNTVFEAIGIRFLANDPEHDGREESE